MNDKLVTVDTFYQLPLAEMAKAVLESAGIECWLTDVHAGGLYFPATLGGIKLQVHSDNEAAALEVLEQLKAQPSDAESDSDLRSE